MVVADAVEQAAVVFLDDFREPFDDANRRAQVVRDGEAERFVVRPERCGVWAFAVWDRDVCAFGVLAGGGRVCERCGRRCGGRRHHFFGRGRGRRCCCQGAGFAQQTLVAGKSPRCIGAGAPAQAEVARAAIGGLVLNVDVVERRVAVELRSQRGLVRRPEVLPQRRARQGRRPVGGRRAARRAQPHESVLGIGLPLPEVEQFIHAAQAVARLARPARGAGCAPLLPPEQRQRNAAEQHLQRRRQPCRPGGGLRGTRRRRPRQPERHAGAGREHAARHPPPHRWSQARRGATDGVHGKIVRMRIIEFPAVQGHHCSGRRSG